MLPFHTGPDLRGDNPANVKAVILSAAGEKKMYREYKKFRFFYWFCISVMKSTLIYFLDLPLIKKNLLDERYFKVYKWHAKLKKKNKIKSYTTS